MTSNHSLTTLLYSLAGLQLADLVVSCIYMWTH